MQDQKLWLHFHKIELNPMMFCIDWFMCVFIKVWLGVALHCGLR